MAEIIAQNPKKATKLLRILIIVIVIIVLIGVGYYLWKNYGEQWGLTKEAQPEISSSGNKLPPGFLEGLPIEAGVVLKDSQTADYGAGEPLLRTISYYSTKTVDADFQDFLSYATANGWSVVNKNDSALAMKSFYATKGENALNVVIGQEALTNKILVTITFLEGQ